MSAGAAGRAVSEAGQGANGRRTCAVLVALALLAHGAGLANGFVYDDHRFVSSNDALRTAGPAALLLDPATQTTDGDRDVYRPLRALGHALDARLWGLDPRDAPFGFHLHSLLAHVAAVLIGWAALRRLLPEPSGAPALLGAGLLAMHPLGVEVAGWISSRGDLYAQAFGCAALWLYARAGTAEPVAGDPRPAAAAGRASVVRRLCIAGAGLLAALACLGKESAVWVPLVAACHLRLLRRGSGRALAAIAAGCVAALALRQWALSGASPVQTAPHGGSLLAQAGWALFGTGRTLLALLFPAHLSIDYPQDDWAGWTLASRLPTMALAAGCVIAAVAWRRRRPAASVLLAWVLLAWLPSSSLLVTLRGLVNGRGAYPMLLPAGALLGLSLARRPRAAAAALAALALLLVPATVRRTQDFRDDATLWRSALVENRRSVRAHLGLAWIAAEAGAPEDVERELAEAVRVAVPDSRLAGIALAGLGDFRLRERQDAAGAEPILRRAAVLQRRWRDHGRPGSDEAATAASLAEALTELQRGDEADAVLDQAIAEAPDRIMLHVKRVALLLLRADRESDPQLRSAALARALAAWQQARALDAAHPLVQALGVRLAERLSRPP